MPIRTVENFLWGDSLPDIAAEWRALWDEESLYVLVAVTDSDDGTRDADIERTSIPITAAGRPMTGKTTARYSSREARRRQFPAGTRLR
ncbi:sugar-binding protein [Natrinema versiforme]|uniref:Carbohydrate-binding domain-containing protein n=1 Tax=Natrinema versiforme TaxID=88724 RepID=A0A4P8WP83_9EURY|nr:hypothetical protein FEJ81_07200 [Natrinema versiforme]